MSSAALDINRDLTEALDAICQKYLRSNDCGSYIMPESTPGISILASFDGKIVANFCRGYALRYVARDGQELPKAQWVEIDDNSIFDLSKLFTTLAILKLFEDGLLALDAPVVQYLTDFGRYNSKSRIDKTVITVKHLLTHTSGFPPEPIPKLDSKAMRELSVNELKQSVMENVCQNDPGSTYVYSEMNQTYYQVPANQYNHCVANEFNEPQAVLGRPQPIRGVVHDEKAYLLRSCAAGHAGVFSTLNDMSKLGSMLACKGKYNGNPILKATTLDLALVDYNSSLSGKEPDAPKTASHGLGFELNQSWYMGALTNLNCFGHTGYTGTSIIITRDVPSFLIILSNRTHPTRTSGQINKLREQSATVFSNYVNKRLTRY